MLESMPRLNLDGAPQMYCISSGHGSIPKFLRKPFALQQFCSAVCQPPQISNQLHSAKQPEVHNMQCSSGVKHPLKHERTDI